MTGALSVVRSFAREFRTRYPAVYTSYFRINHWFWTSLEVVMHYGFVPAILFLGLSSSYNVSIKNVLVPFSTIKEDKIDFNLFFGSLDDSIQDDDQNKTNIQEI